MSLNLGIRWTVGDVSDEGFEALRLSIWGAHRLFGADAAYAVCVNSIPVDTAQRKTGDVPAGVNWHDATGDVPAFLRNYFDPAMAEGVGWKLAPPRYFPDRFELCLDNDVIFTAMPSAIALWLTTDPSFQSNFADGPRTQLGVSLSNQCLMAQDVAAHFGVFADMCPSEARNAGIRGFPPHFDLRLALQTVLEEKATQLDMPLILSSETDEQGLQTAALSRDCPPLTVTIDEVTICSPFKPHVPRLGTRGAHFVGLNARRFPWEFDGRNASEYIRENWTRHREVLYEKIGIAPASPVFA